MHFQVRGFTLLNPVNRHRSVCNYRFSDRNSVCVVLKEKTLPFTPHADSSEERQSQRPAMVLLALDRIEQAFTLPCRIYAPRRINWTGAPLSTQPRSFRCTRFPPGPTRC